jgi:hypothetical protein
MNDKLGMILLVLLIGLSLASQAKATTWADKQVVCPICNTTNTFKEVMSYGTYIYQWPSKYQYIFWPLTDSPVLYSCKKCHLTAFMWDYLQIPKEKLATVQTALNGVAINGDQTEYTKIPMSQRLHVAEKVYSVLEKDDRFWCQFYRVQGYHLEEEKQPAEADEARRKALDIAERMILNTENAGTLKELLIITGAMRHLLKDDAGALSDFKRAQGLKYENSKIEKKATENVDAYLTELLSDYVQKINNPPPPKG